MSKREHNTPSLRALIFALRNKETWPPQWRWNYLNCENCAMGLAYRLWPGRMELTTAGVASAIGIKDEDATRIFTQMGAGVSAQMIADELEQLETA